MHAGGLFVVCTVFEGGVTLGCSVNNNYWFCFHRDACMHACVCVFVVVFSLLFCEEESFVASPGGEGDE